MQQPNHLAITNMVSNTSENSRAIDLTVPRNNSEQRAIEIWFEGCGVSVLNGRRDADLPGHCSQRTTTRGGE